MGETEEEGNKVVESLEKGNKSYYYWSRSLNPEAIGNVNPQLLTKQAIEVPKTRNQITIESYYWDEDKQWVKIYIPLEGIGKHPSENVHSSFAPDSFELEILDFKDADYRLGLPRLYDAIIPSESKHRITPNKVILSLKKKKEKKWGFLRAPVKP